MAVGFSLSIRRNALVSANSRQPVICGGELPSGSKDSCTWRSYPRSSVVASQNSKAALFRDGGGIQVEK